MKTAIPWTLLGVWAAWLLVRRWQAFSAEWDRTQANRNPMVRRDDMRDW